MKSKIYIAFCTTIIFLCMFGKAWAGDELWQYTAYLTNIPGVSNSIYVGRFNTVAEAEAAMFAAHPYAEHLVRINEDVSQYGSVTISYKIPNEKIIWSDWRYHAACTDMIYGINYGSEAEAVDVQKQKYLSLYATHNPPLCSIDSVTTEIDWGSSSSGRCNLGSSLYYQEKQIRYDGVWSAGCTGSTYWRDYLYRSKTFQCPSYLPTINRATDECSNYMSGSISSVSAARLSVKQDCEGNPCMPANGMKYQVEHDFQFSNFNFNRIFISDQHLNRNSGFGIGWSHSFNQKVINRKDIKYNSNTAYLMFIGDNGFLERFKSLSANRYSSVTSPGRIFTINADNTLRLDATTSISEFDVDGYLVSIKYPSGSNIYLNYIADNKAGKILDTVQNDYGQSIKFSYAVDGSVTSIVASDGSTYDYEYESYIWYGVGKYRVSRVHKPNGTSRQYTYADTVYPAYLTGIIDENNQQYGTYVYDYLGRVVDSQHPNSASTIHLTYNPSVIVTNSRGHNIGYRFENNYYVSELRTSNLVTDGVTTKTKVSGTNGLPLWSSDITGVRTWYYYTGYNTLYNIREADATAQQRNTYFYYDDTRFPLLITRKEQPSVYTGLTTARKTTSRNYDDGGRATQITVSGFDTLGNPISRTTALQYNGPLNQLSQIDGPRTDVNDITTFDYYLNDASQGNNRGRLQRVTLANGTIARDNIQYSATGKVLSETRPNGLSITYSYEPLSDRLSTMAQSDGTNSHVTSWSYTPTGLVKTITTSATTSTPITLTFGYDDAHRLTRITDAQGNYIEYVLDTEDNKTNENVYDATGVLQRALAQTFDLYNHLKTTSQANESRTTNFALDGTLSNTLDGKNVKSQYSYDALKRLLTSTQDVGGTDATTQNALTKYGYDVHDNLTSVIDPVNGKTSYVYDDLNNLLSQTSPDTGTTVFTYDAAGNVLTRTDAKGQVFSYQYDALNRLTQVTTPNSSDSISYVYDTCTNGVGRLCSVTQNGNTVTYTYDAFGQVTNSQYINYTYDDHGRLGTLIYPSGNALTYSYDNLGHVSGVNATINGQSLALVSNATYAPFGPLTNLTYGNALPMTRTFDTAYRLLDTTAGNALSLTGSVYDANGNLTQRTESLLTTLYNYDALERLDTASGWFGARDYNLDKNGNRTQDIAGSTTTKYTYTTYSNRLSAINGTAVVIDANGNTTSLRGMSLAYDNFNRVSTVNGATYGYNALNQRVTKLVNGIATTYLYGLNGELLAELDASGNTQVEYYYANGVTVGVNQQGNVYYIHTDQLGTPRAMTDANQKVIWRWDSDPFGVGTANDDPDADGVKVTMNLRFPGQYYDAESGLHYNYHRYYDPQSGRYVTSDPIGLNGGLNTYGYVGGNPIKLSDPLGLVNPAEMTCIDPAQPICWGGVAFDILWMGSAIKAYNDVGRYNTPSAGPDNSDPPGATILPFKPKRVDCPSKNPDEPDECELLHGDLLIEQIKIREDIRRPSPKRNDIQNARDIRSRKERWNEKAREYNRTCVPKGYAPITDFYRL